MSSCDPGHCCGQYLTPEPMLQKPLWLRLQAEAGRAPATYAYAANNPIRYADSTGLDIKADENTCSPETRTMITKLRNKLRSGNIKSKKCKKLFDEVGLAELAQSDTVYSVFCSNKDAIPDCSDPTAEPEEVCGHARPESTCVDINENKKRTGCPSIAARFIHEVVHCTNEYQFAGDQLDSDDVEGRDLRARLTACANLVANE